MVISIIWAIAGGMALTNWFNPLTATSHYDGARFLELAILAWVNLVLLAIADLRKGVLALISSLPRRIRLLLVSLALLAGASALQSRFPASALLEVGLTILLLHFACACAIVAHQRKNDTDRIFVSSLLVGAAIFVIFFILSYKSALDSGEHFNWIRPFVTFGNIRLFSNVQAYTLPLMLLPLLAFETSKTLRAAVILIAALWWALHFASGSRSVWVALIISTLVMLLWLRRTALPWLSLQGRLFLLGGAIYGVLAWWYDELNRNESYGISGIISRGLDGSGRLELWREAWAMIRFSPWLGAGPMHFGFYNFKVAAHPHNTWLQIAAEYGLPMALLLTFLLFSFLGYTLRWCSTPVSARDRNINICLTASLLCGLADGMFSGNTLMPQSQLLMFFITGWLVGRNLSQVESPTYSSARNHSPDWRKPGGQLHAWAQTTLVVIIIATLSMQMREATRYHTFRKFNGFDWTVCYHPRYWQNGHRPAGGPDLLPKQKN